MNPEAQEIFDKIVKKDPKDLTYDEILFLHARRPYLTSDQMRIFGEVIAKRDAELEALKNPEPPLYVSKKQKRGKNK